VEGLLPEWEPRGNRIAFQQMKRRDAWYGGLWTLSFEGGRVGDLRTVFSSDRWAAIQPSWSPDGSRLVFSTVGKSPRRASIRHEGDDLWTVNADGSAASRLSAHSAADGMPTWAPDGRIYFVSKRSGSDRIWSLLPRLAN
jgi:Tol biopolymer transport system component